MQRGYEIFEQQKTASNAAYQEALRSLADECLTIADSLAEGEEPERFPYAAYRALFPAYKDARDYHHMAVLPD